MSVRPFKSSRCFKASDRQTDRQTDRYFIDRKKIITNLFVIEMKEIYVHLYTTLLIC